MLIRQRASVCVTVGWTWQSDLARLATSLCDSRISALVADDLPWKFASWSGSPHQLLIASGAFLQLVAQDACWTSDKSKSKTVRRRATFACLSIPRLVVEITHRL